MSAHHMTAVLWVAGAWVGLSVVTAAAFHFAKRSYLRSLGIRVGAPGTMPPTPHQQIVQQAVREHIAWRNFVDAHMWAGACPDCIVVVHEPSEAEDAVAVWSPCKAHEPGVAQ